MIRRTGVRKQQNVADDLPVISMKGRTIPENRIFLFTSHPANFDFE